MRNYLYFAILFTFILSSCTNAKNINSAETEMITTAIRQDTPTATPAIALTTTATYEVQYQYMVETPFWKSYETGTPVPIFFESLDTKREEYREISIDEGVAAGWWMLPFKNDFEKAIKENLDWIKYPEQIALRISGYPNPDYPSPEEIKLYQTSDDIIAIVNDWNMGDDSVFAYEYRVEMKQFSSYWKVTWLGVRWQCRRGHQDWGITLCT